MPVDLLSAFPLITDGVARTVFVRGLEQDMAEILTERGYTVVELMTMPRNNPVEEQTYLLAKCQAMEEGTIAFTTEDRRTLELAMKSAGLLDSKRTMLNLKVDIDGDDVEKMLNWNNSRHTLAENSTVQAAKTFKELKGKN
ncbi:MAG: hypothetical protein CMJ20_06895 [Phycisphaeraceae bacterium]|nr:hypothetical protein [Phycisphaeraceae bacterium]|tara:strand:+ start:306 stop:728 length:423 start_codon:yes stop_codon:yes gene_type:complete